MKTQLHNLAQSIRDLLGLSKSHIENNDIHVTTEDKEEWYRNSRLVTSGGTKNAFTLPIDELYDGLMITFIAGVSNLSETTTINGKPLLIPGNYSTPPRIIQGRPYTVWYSTTNIDYPDGAFFIKASATGDATAANVLAGKTFSNDTGIGLTGTMLDRSGQGIDGTWTNPVGGTTINAFPSLSAYVTTDSAVQVRDINLIPANILSGKSIFGVAGSVTPGGRSASGSVLSSSATTPFVNSTGGTASQYFVQTPVLAFIPSIIYICRADFQGDAAFATKTVFVNGGGHTANIVWSNTTVRFRRDMTNNPILPAMSNGQLYYWYAWE